MRFVLRLSIFLLLSACTGNDKSYLPDEKKFEEDTTLMINITNKFAEEPDAKKLHAAVIGVQNSRVMSCTDYNGECSLYGNFLSLAIRASEDNVISISERSQMKKAVLELKTTIEKSKRTLRAEWAKKQQK